MWCSRSSWWPILVINCRVLVATAANHSVRPGHSQPITAKLAFRRRCGRPTGWSDRPEFPVIVIIIIIKIIIIIIIIIIISSTIASRLSMLQDGVDDTKTWTTGFLDSNCDKKLSWRWQIARATQLFIEGLRERTEYVPQLWNWEKHSQSYVILWTSVDICVVVHDDLGWKNRITRYNRFWRAGCSRLEYVDTRSVY